MVWHPASHTLWPSVPLTAAQVAAYLARGAVRLALSRPADALRDFDKGACARARADALVRAHVTPPLPPQLCRSPPSPLRRTISRPSRARMWANTRTPLSRSAARSRPRRRRMRRRPQRRRRAHGGPGTAVVARPAARPRALAGCQWLRTDCARCCTGGAAGASRARRGVRSDRRARVGPRVTSARACVCVCVAGRSFQRAHDDAVMAQKLSEELDVAEQVRRRAQGGRGRPDG